MGKDTGLKVFFSDNARYADVVNGIGFQGRQVICEEDLQDLDTQTGIWKSPGFIQSSRKRKDREKRVKYRDMVRKVGIGMSFAIVGIENQEEIDYSIPLRNLSYDVDEYERQAAKIRKEVRKNHKGLNKGEFLYGFRKESKLHPVITIILYYGKEPWDGATHLYQILDFQGIPKELRKMVPNYRVNLIEIRKLKDTSVFKTDVRQVFDFIRCSENPEELEKLVKSDSAYQNMAEDAFDVITEYASADELVKVKDYYKKDGRIDMCRGLTELIAQGKENGKSEGRIEGRTEGRMEGMRALIETCQDFGIPKKDVFLKIAEKFSLSDVDAEKYINEYWK